MPNWEQLNFQNGSNPLTEQLIYLHDHIMSILVLIMTLVSYSIIVCVTSKKTTSISENHNLETLWTFLPGLTLILIAFPSLRILYMTEETEYAPISLKVMGHQWYWSYEYSNFLELEFDSFMKTTDQNSFRLLETDNKVILPFSIPTSMFISSFDVLHSWTIPAMGLKVDASPGRLNNISFWSYKPGMFFGQCSEICGTNHSFMPIMLLITNNHIFKTWMKTLMNFTNLF